MSLLNKASLIQIPSGYKDGTLYSAKPTNGDGDFTFSRGSNLAATRVNSDGLIEKGRENLLTYSNDLTQWTPSGVGSTTATTDPLGGNKAFILNDQDTGAYYRIASNTVSITGVVTSSVYIKKTTGALTNYAGLEFNDESVFVIFDTTNGTYNLTATSPYLFINVASAYDDWWRVSFAVSSFTSGQYGLRLWSAISSDGSTLSASATGSNIFYAPQTEQGLVATEYIETGATTAQAGILEDMPRLDYSGGATCPSLLLEPQRINYIPQSEPFSGGDWISLGGATIVSNASVSPQGVQNAAEVQGTSGSSFIGDVLNLTASTAHTTSFYIKNNDSTTTQFWAANESAYSINWDGLTIDSVDSGVYYESVGNDWYRVWSTADSNSDGQFITRFYPSNSVASVYLYGYQVEQGSYPTSYIPTYGASVTRGNEELDLSNWVSKGIISDSNEWTIFYEVDGLTTDYDVSDSQWLRGQDSTIDVYIRAGNTNEEFARFYWRKDSKYIGSTFGKKIIARLSGGTGTTFADGVEIASSSISGDYSNIGLDMGSSNAAGFVKQAIIFPTALSDDECIQLTTI